MSVIQRLSFVALFAASLAMRVPQEAGKLQERTILLEDFERDGDWDGIVETKNFSPFNTHSLEAQASTGTFAREMAVEIKPVPALACEKTWLSFDCFVKDSDFIALGLFVQGDKERIEHRIAVSEQGKWTLATLEVTAAFKKKGANGAPIRRGDKIEGIFFAAGKEGNKAAQLFVDNVRLYGSVHAGDEVGPAKPEGPGERLIFLENFERPGTWRGIWNDKKTPVSQKRALSGEGDEQYFGRKIRVGVRRPPLAVAKKTWVSFDYYVKNSTFLTVFLFDLDIGDNCRYTIEKPALGKWTSAALEVTEGERLKEGHKIDDIFFFAGEAGNKQTELIIDNVRLYGSLD